MADVKPNPDEHHPLPERIGPYRVTGIIGHGGMATVYAAMQKSPRRIVAVKVLRPGAIDAVAVKRFRREIEILGTLKHPCIAQVFEAGTYHDGGGELPFFAMERIDGAKTIVDFANEEKLDRRARLKLFVMVCAAIEQAHALRVIHRDIKPSNILVDRKGQPKVIDFGVASAPDIRVGPDTRMTEAGRLIGTIQYMAPEQVSGENTDLDPRCDVYALGTLLYRLLTDHMPHDLLGLPVYEAARVIREDDPTRVSKHVPSLRGDLETIIHTAIARERDRRYASAGSLGRDVKRYLDQRPIRARPASLMYRFRLMTKRHRTFVRAVSAVLIIAIIAGGVTTGFILHNQRKAEGLSDTLDNVRGERDNAQQLADERAEALRKADEEAAAKANIQPPAPPIDLVHFNGTRHALQFDATGRYLFAGADDGAVECYDLDTGETLFTTIRFEHPVQAIDVTNDGRVVVAIDTDGNILTLETSTGAPIERQHFRAPAINQLALSNDGMVVVLLGGDLAIRFMRLDNGAERIQRSSSGEFNFVRFIDDRDTLLATTSTGRMMRFDTLGESQRWRIETGERPLLDVAASGDVIRTVDTHGAMHVFRLEDGMRMGRQRFLLDNKTPTQARWHSAGTRLALLENQNTLHVLDVDDETHKTIVSVTLPANITSFTFDGTGTQLACDLEGGVVRVFFLPPITTDPVH